MIGNAAGPVMSVYLLSMRKEKMEYIGINTWFFLVVNLLKVPFQIFDPVCHYTFCSNDARIGHWVTAHFVYNTHVYTIFLLLRKKISHYFCIFAEN